MTESITTTDKATTEKERPIPRAVVYALAVGLAVVITAPIVLSSQDLIRWASDPSGLGLEPRLAWLAFVALDAAAAVCVGMVTVAARKSEAGGAFSVLIWTFAAGSAVANYRHGQTTPARDDEYFFPAMSLAGPLLLEATLARVRRWTRITAKTQLAARPRFGLRWLPGVGFRETLRAWKAALREGIARPDEAILWVRQVAALRDMTDQEALVTAWVALARPERPAGPLDVRDWLLARGRTAPAITEKEIRQLPVGPGHPKTPGPMSTTSARATGQADPSGLARANETGRDSARAEVVPLRAVARPAVGRADTGPPGQPGPGQADDLWPDALQAARALHRAGRRVTRAGMQAGIQKLTGQSIGNGRADKLVASAKGALDEKRGSGAPAGRTSDGR